MTKERPILFSGPMVRAILEGRKTQTRRVIKPQPNLKDRNTLSSELMTEAWQAGFVDVHSPYNRHGRLWVRETWAVDGPLNVAKAQHEDALAGRYVAGSGPYYRATEPAPDSLRWRPSIFMPRWASRIVLEIEEVRVQRLQEISPEDAKTEGVKRGPCNCANWVSCGCPLSSYRLAFSKLWESINAKRGFGWDRDPFVWVIGFRRSEER